MSQSHARDAKRIDRREGYPTYQAKPQGCRIRTPDGEAVALSIKPVAGRVAACLDAASRPEKQTFSLK
jgi:hypothetical protein